MGSRQKKLAFLAGHSGKALTPPPPTGKWNKGIYAIIFLHIKIYMFLKPANSVTENVLKKIMYSESWKTGKVFFLYLILKMFKFDSYIQKMYILEDIKSYCKKQRFI